MTAQERYWNAGAQVATLVQRFLQPVYGTDAAGQPDFEGSSILLRVGEMHFVISAAHVFASVNDTPILLPDDGKGELRLANQPETTRPERFKEDLVDFGYVPLTTDEAHRFSATAFLTPLDLEPLDHILHRAGYVALGYPASLQRRDVLERTHHAELAYYTSLEVPDSQYRAARFHRAFHILLRYSRASIVSTRQDISVPGFAGISGGGVWRVDPTELERQGRAVLVGIATSHPARLKKSILATRIELVLATLRHHFPELRGEIPPSPLLAVNVESV